MIRKRIKNLVKYNLKKASVHIKNVKKTNTLPHLFGIKTSI